MKEKFLQFFTGKMNKSIYISIAAAVVCGAVVITSVVVVHNNNQKIDAVLESLSASDSMTESVSESAEESVSASGNEESQPQAQAANNEPAGDKALQYLAEYDKLTAEYQAKRAELKIQPYHGVELEMISAKPERQIYNGNETDTAEQIAEKQAKYDRQYQIELEKWENESRKIDEQRIQQEKDDLEISNHNKEIQDQIDALDTQYEKDVAALKAKYGIA